jgi:hypothetical protein
MDAGAVERHPRLLAHLVEPVPLAHRRVEPAEGRHHVLARLEDARHHRRVGEQRAVEDAVGLHAQQGIDVGGGSDAHGVTAYERADVGAVLLGRVDPAPDELEVGVVQHPFDRRPPDVARGPLDHPHGTHRTTPRT